MHSFPPEEDHILIKYILNLSRVRAEYQNILISIIKYMFKPPLFNLRLRIPSIQLTILGPGRKAIVYKKNQKTKKPKKHLDIFKVTYISVHLIADHAQLLCFWESNQFNFISYHNI